MKNSRTRIPVGIIGATGTVGRQFLKLLSNHPWFQISCVAASARSEGKLLGKVYKERFNETLDDDIAGLKLFNAVEDITQISGLATLVFSAITLSKDEIKKLEEDYAKAGIAVISNNSAHRWTDDIPMIIPEVNPHHCSLIDIQRENRGWTSGLIAVKSNCSIQSYVPVLEAWKKFIPEKVMVATYQAVSGAGKTLSDWPEMQDNVNPLIGGEEEKSELEPLKIWGDIIGRGIRSAELPTISTTCVRVPVSDGHMAVTHVSFASKPSKEELIEALLKFRNPLRDLELPSAPSPFLIYFNEEDRPQTALDRMAGNGMAITVGRIREDSVLDYKFVALSHNTLRGAAGGGVLLAELLHKKGYF